MAVAGVLLALSHLIGSFSKKLASASKYFIKEGLLTLMMFNAFNIAFGVGVHFHYADPQSDSYVLSSLAAVLAASLIFGTCVLLIATKPKQFGEFKNKLKSDPVCQLYFVVSLIYRFCLGYYIAVEAEYLMSSLIAIAISMFFMLYTLVNLPFKQAYQNYRSNLCHLSQLIILVVGNYYGNMMFNEPWEKKAYLFNAAEVQLVAIYITVGFSAICLVYDIVVYVKSKFIKPGKNKIKG